LLLSFVAEFGVCLKPAPKSGENTGMFSILKKTEDKPVSDTSAAKPAAKAPAPDHPLDALTGGAFSAATSGERTARVRQWLAANPSVQQMQEVFKELSVKDKGAAKPLREKLDELKRTKGQEAIAAEWADKAAALLAGTRLNIADALAWQRDAAKAGAPLSKEPLASVKTQLAERVRLIEDLQHQAQVQREASMLLAQRIEVLSTKPWGDAQTAQEQLGADVQGWQTQAQALLADAQWPSADAKFATQLDAARNQLRAVWDAFSAALAQAIAASTDPQAPLPAVPVWADAIRALRGVASGETARAERAARPKVDPEVRAKATQIVREQLSKLEHELSEGHGKASVAAANAVRAALKEHGANIGDKLESAAQHALGAAGELEGWQRWRANQIREELIARAQTLVKEPLGGRKQQEAVRHLRDAWKQTDQGGVPNHGMWKRFDDACNEAYKMVEAWLEKVKAEESIHKTQRLELIEEIKAWTTANAERSDWKEINRELHALSERWRLGGHVGEKTFDQLQPLYKEAIKAAHATLDAAQTQSLARRHAMIEEASVLGAAPSLRIDAVKALQQRWQHEAQSVPVDRKQEQKLWDAFRKPIDDAFNRKGAEREQAAAAMGAHDRAVLDAVKALDAANASGDVQKIRAAMAALEAASRGAPSTPATGQAAPAAAQVAPAVDLEQNTSSAQENRASAAIEIIAPEAPQTESTDAAVDSAPAQAAEKPVPAKPAKPIVAMRGDDRPGAKKAEPAPQGRFGDKKGGKFEGRGERGGRDAGRPASPGRDGDARGFAGRGADRMAERGGPRSDDRFADNGPRLSNTAYYAQRDAIERAQQSLKKLAAQAHGESLTQLLSAWEQRKPDAVPSAGELGRVVSPAARTAWMQSLGKTPSADAKAASTALLRIEMAAEVPTPAEHLNERRALQLQLLTKRNDPAPVDTWALDTTQVLASAHDAAAARRLQTALKALLR
jgi:ATP-dependent RNA helicase SUPV3L1/SUV3